MSAGKIQSYLKHIEKQQNKLYKFKYSVSFQSGYSAKRSIVMVKANTEKEAIDKAKKAQPGGSKFSIMRKFKNS